MALESARCSTNVMMSAASPDGKSNGSGSLYWNATPAKAPALNERMAGQRTGGMSLGLAVAYSARRTK